jgi:hypothetical protein
MWVVALALIAGGDTAFAGGDSPGSAPAPAAPSSTFADGVKDLPLTLTVLAPSGVRYRLAYAGGPGWQFVGRVPDHLLLASNGDVALSPPQTSSGNQPQSILIDGPTGYTFVWIPERGWQFVGRLAEPSR